MIGRTMRVDLLRSIIISKIGNIIHPVYKIDNVQDTIGKLYEKTGFMQKYGGSAVFTFVVLLAYGITMSYFKVSNHLKQIRSNWVKDRCNLQ